MKLFRWITGVVVIHMMTGCSLSLADPPIKQPIYKQPIHQQSDLKLDTEKVKAMQKQPITHLPNLGLQAKSVILIDAEHGNILYDKNSDQPLPTASMSKMMTELLVLRAIRDHKITWEQPVSISDYANTISNHPGFASVHLNKEQTYTVRELFNAMAIHSANGATIALAESVSGTERDFVMEMNSTAKQLRLDHSHFVDSTGLSNLDIGVFSSTGTQNDTNMMSAKDVALLAKQLILEFPQILNIVDQPSFSFEQHTYTNTNWMLPKMNKQNIGYDGVDGLKTGYTDEAGYCFVGTVNRNEKRLISVVMGAATKVSRFTETKRLYDAAYQQIE